MGVRLRRLVGIGTAVTTALGFGLAAPAGATSCPASGAPQLTALTQQLDPFPGFEGEFGVGVVVDAACPPPDSYGVAVWDLRWGHLTGQSILLPPAIPINYHIWNREPSVVLRVDVTPRRAGLAGPTRSMRISPQGWWEVTPSSPLYDSVQQPLVGGMVLSVVDGRSYGMLGYAWDPNFREVPRMRVRIEGVETREVGWNYTWPEMPAHTGLDTARALVFLARLPPGERSICLEAYDGLAQSWTPLGCDTVRVK